MLENDVDMLRLSRVQIESLPSLPASLKLLATLLD